MTTKSRLISLSDLVLNYSALYCQQGVNQVSELRTGFRSLSFTESRHGLDAAYYYSFFNFLYIALLWLQRKPFVLRVFFFFNVDLILELTLVGFGHLRMGCVMLVYGCACVCRMEYLNVCAST